MPKVLVVEDLESDWRLIDRQLRREVDGYEGTWVADVDALTPALAAGGWDVVLADHALPGTDFASLLARLQAALPDVPVVLISGTVGEDTAVDLLRRGVADFVLKDRPARLAPAIERAIAERRQRDRAAEARLALARSEARWRALLAAMADGVCVVQHGRIDYCNDALAGLLGTEAAGCHGRTLEDCCAPDPLPEAWSLPASLRARLSGVPGPQERCDLPFRTAEGRPHWVELRISSLDHDGQPAALVVVRDIDERRRLTEALAAHRDHLEQLVAERTRKAEAASRAKSAFLANMSHEIRTPLTAIIGLTHLMRADPEGRPLEPRLQRVHEAAEHLLAILDDVLELSRIEAGRLGLTLVDFTLDELLARSVALVQPAADRKGLRLVVDRGDVPLALHGDPTRLSQALVNLLSNAVKFTEHGEVRLSCRRDASLPAPPDAWGLRFEVEDTGVGVDPQRVEALFEAFVQADDSTTRRHGGSGLGLAITRRLAQWMGGDAGGAPREGGGSRFWFRAQLRHGKAVPPLPTGRDTALALAADVRRLHAGARVLLAEDNAVNEEVATALLQAAGLLVDVARTGREALSRLERAPYDLVLMDVQMPDMDGLAATRHWRASSGPGARVPVLAMTANAFGDDRDACLAAGMDDHLGKPVDPARLYERLLRWLPASAPALPLANTVAVAAGPHDDPAAV